ncbi:MAG TPA: heterodisulfide reductase-related iron-sulfur binding cluster [Polyangiaceae bacterium]|nr:heterodisulfide reductase-related iron-sulfur binding cluster [Polyangiaceae bacterium]
MAKVPARAPKITPVHDPNDQRYWDARDLEQELRRTFQICHECRMCVTYCGSFPRLFEAIDKAVDHGAEGAETIGAETMRTVSDHCWQCKLCFIKCPYTADEGAQELLDFPRLMAREKANRARREGIPLVDRILGEPQLIGALSVGPSAKLANLVNANRLVRKVVEKVTGISAHFPLPPIASKSFTSWFAEHDPAPEAGQLGEVILFPTCYGDFNFPRVPEAAVRVLEINGYEVDLPDGLTCCGMPNLDGGDVEAAKQKMRHNVEMLLPYVEQGLRIVVPGPTCGYTMKKEWPLYLGTPEAAKVAAATLDLMEFVDGLRKNKTLNKNFARGFGRVAYHAACHLRAQKIAFPGARVLSQLPDTDVRIIERCSAVDGTWGMKAVYYEEGRRYAQKLASAIDSEREDEQITAVTDCSLAALRMLKDSALVAKHPIELLAEAYAPSAAVSASSAGASSKALAVGEEEEA